MAEAYVEGFEAGEDCTATWYRIDGDRFCVIAEARGERWLGDWDGYKIANLDENGHVIGKTTADVHYTARKTSELAASTLRARRRQRLTGLRHQSRRPAPRGGNNVEPQSMQARAGKRARFGNPLPVRRGFFKYVAKHKTGSTRAGTASSSRPSPAALRSSPRGVTPR